MNGRLHLRHHSQVILTGDRPYTSRGIKAGVLPNADPSQIQRTKADKFIDPKPELMNAEREAPPAVQLSRQSPSSNFEAELLPSQANRGLG